MAVQAELEPRSGSGIAAEPLVERARRARRGPGLPVLEVSSRSFLVGGDVGDRADQRERPYACSVWMIVRPMDMKVDAEHGMLRNHYR